MSELAQLGKTMSVMDMALKVRHCDPATAIVFEKLGQASLQGSSAKKARHSGRKGLRIIERGQQVVPSHTAVPQSLACHVDRPHRGRRK